MLLALSLFVFERLLLALSKAKEQSFKALICDGDAYNNLMLYLHISVSSTSVYRNNHSWGISISIFFWEMGCCWNVWKSILWPIISTLLYNFVGNVPICSCSPEVDEESSFCHISLCLKYQCLFKKINK